MSDETVAAVRDLIDPAAIVALTTELIAARSENPGTTEQACVAVLERACRERGFAVETWEVAPGRPNLIATTPARSVANDPTDGAGLLFLGHSDVVPAGPGWRADPFVARVVDGRIIGRGSADMLGGLAAIIVAMDAAYRSGAELPGPISLAVTVDEEDLDIGVRELVGHADRFRDKYWGCVVAEPTGLDVVVACRGDAYIEIDVTGVAAHSGRPEDGRNAIDAAAAIVDLIRADHDRLRAGSVPPLGSGSWNVGRIEGGRGTSTVAPSCRLWVDRRLMPGDDPEPIVAGLLDSVDSAGVTGDGIAVSARVTMEMPGFATDPSEPIVTASAAAALRAGGRGRLESWTAACDGGFVSRDFGIPTVVFGPGSITEQAHQPEESVAVAELEAAAHAYALLALGGA